MSEIPPKQAVSGTAAARVEANHGLPPLAEESPSLGETARPSFGSEGALVSIHAAALQAGSGSFPVLKAFQDYLETERQRARRRIVMLSGFFVALMVIVVAGLLAGGLFLFRNMQRTQDVLLQAALKAPVQTEQPAATLQPAAAPAEADATQAIGEEIRRLSAAVESVRSENERLTAQLAARPASAAAPLAQPARSQAAIAAKPPASSRAVAKSSAPIAAVGKAPQTSPTASVPNGALAAVASAATATITAEKPTSVPVAPPRKAPLEIAAGVTPQAPEGYEDSLLYLPRKGSDEPLPWRVFIPLR